jgi:hypothetical protein
MKYFYWPLLVVSLIALANCANMPVLESSEDLGFGFHHDVIAEPTASTFEGIGHFDYLFYRKRRLSQTDKFAVAPSGSAVVYQDGPSGNVFIFRRKGGEITPLTQTFIGLVQRFEWHEGSGYILALSEDAKGNKRWTKLGFKPRK